MGSGRVSNVEEAWEKGALSERRKKEKKDEEAEGMRAGFKDAAYAASMAALRR